MCFSALHYRLVSFTGLYMWSLKKLDTGALVVRTTHWRNIRFVFVGCVGGFAITGKGRRNTGGSFPSIQFLLPSDGSCTCIHLVGMVRSDPVRMGLDH